jgi:hypothetical protein
MREAGGAALTFNPLRQERQIVLPGGKLHLFWTKRSWEIDDLCTFAARKNQRRGFLIISRVLGRHLPARPSIISAASDDLAALIPGNLDGPVLFIGMAETAISLGQAVHNRWRRLHDRDDSLYLHSTRQQLKSEPFLRFSEPHSHACSHLLYAPDTKVWPRWLDRVRSLVLVDDEVTTGCTLSNLVTSLAPHLPKLERTEVAVLTDWSCGKYLQDMPHPARASSLLEGELVWEALPDLDPPLLGSTGQLGHLDQRRNLGRLGSNGIAFDFTKVSKELSTDKAMPLHVIGTGELHYPALLLAEWLEQEGYDVFLQGTTRSPARIGGEISAALILSDNYGTGVPNYLYNPHETASRRRIICQETGSQSLDPALVRSGDMVLDFGTPE